MAFAIHGDQIVTGADFEVRLTPHDVPCERHG
jgi:hypothetical protein